MHKGINKVMRVGITSQYKPIGIFDLRTGIRSTDYHQQTTD
jgi:hypothetical protein